MTEVSEVIELLEKARFMLPVKYSTSAKNYIDQALALLRPCGTCGGKGVILNDCLALAHPEYENCPDCQRSADGTIDIETLKKIDKACGDKLSHDEPAEKPPAEVTKHIRNEIAHCSSQGNWFCRTIITLCDRLDAAEAEIRRLKNAN